MRPLTAEDVVERSRSVSWAALDDDVVLLDWRSHKLHVVNRTAGAIWERLDGQRAASDIAEELASLAGAPAAQVLDDVVALVGTFVEAGLTGDGDPPTPTRRRRFVPVTPPPPSGPVTVDDLGLADAPEAVRAALDAVEWRARLGPFAALGFTFDLRATDAEVAARLGALFRPLATGRVARSGAVLSVAGPDGAGTYRAFRDDRHVCTTTDPSVLVESVVWDVNDRALRSSDDLVLVHAAAAARDGTAVVLPAPMESGKSTLVAGLVRRGLDYVTDEIAAVELGSPALRPYPRSLTLDPGSWPLFPELAEHGGATLRGVPPRRWYVDPEVLRAGSAAGTATVRAVVCPRYDPDGPTALEPISRAEAFEAMLASSFNLAHVGPAGFDALVAVVRGSTCARLVMQDLDSSCELVEQLLGQEVRGGC